jgi:hypothetical protein
MVIWWMFADDEVESRLFAEDLGLFGHLGHSWKWGFIALAQIFGTVQSAEN